MRPHVLLIVETAYSFGRALLAGINDYVVSHEPWSITFDFRGLMLPTPKWLAEWSGDGIISRSSDPKLVNSVRARNIPTIDLTDFRDDLGLPRIWADHQAIGRMAAAHFLERGFSKFAFCGFSDHLWSKGRRDGFLNAVRPLDPSPRVFESPWNPADFQPWDKERADLADWLLKLPKPIALLACNDVSGQLILDVCREHSLAVPEEIAVLGVDDDEILCRFCDPSLSSVVPNSYTIGYEAASALDQLMRGQPLAWSERTIPPLRVVTRQSTDILAIDDPIIAQAVHQIRQYACTGLTIPDVLAKIPLSRSVLERRFRKFLGHSPQAEIRKVKIQRVKQLLTESDLTLERIASLTGFEHPEYLNVLFRREVGETPGRYRSRLQRDRNQFEYRV